MAHLRTEIFAEQAKAMTAQQELSLLRNAFRQGKANGKVRESYVRLLLLDEAFGEAIEVLEVTTDRSFSEEAMLTQAWLSVETVEGNAKASESGTRALLLAASDPERAAALAARGKAETRLGEFETARDSLNAALDLDPANKDACKRLVALDLAANRPDAVLALFERLHAQGAGHARLFAAQTLAQARSGDFAAAANSGGMPDLFESTVLEPPPGWSSIEQFNDALAEELLAHPGMRYERYGSASVKTWRIEAPARHDTPLFKTLLERIVEALGRYGEATDGSDHPWAAHRPDAAFLRNWCVITEGEGFEDWHVHQFGWASGVYYVQVPDEISNGTGPEGCLAFGLPADLAGEQGSAGYGEHMVRPRSGLFMAFPSFSYHRTYPHHTGGKRICVAFDVRPLPAHSDGSAAPAG